MAILQQFIAHLHRLARLRQQGTFHIRTRLQIGKQGGIDAETGLLSHQHFVDLLHQQVDRARRSGSSLALLLVDIDLLSHANHIYSYLAGDAVVVGISQIIRRTIRVHDIAGRISGERFAVVLPDVDSEEAKSIAERLRQAVEAASFRVAVNTTPLNVTVSLGVASLSESTAAPEELLHEAGVALSRAKLLGSNRVISMLDIFLPPTFEQVAAAKAPEMLKTAESIFGNDGQYRASTGKQTPKPDTTDTPAVVEQKQPFWLRVFVWGTVIVAIGIALGGFVLGTPVDWGTVVLLTVLVGIVELLDVNLYGKVSISVSVALHFASGLLVGVPGVAAVSIAIILIHAMRRRPRLYKIAFNWATHVLAGLAPVIAISIADTPVQAAYLPALLMPIVLAALAYYGINAGLVTAAISLFERVSPGMIWREQFKWLVGHYLALCGVGLCLSFGYTAIGPLGLVVFVLPVLMMRYAQKQYVDQTQDNVQTLRRMNRELSHANREIIAANQSIRQLNDELFLTLAKIFDARDPYVSGHAAKVADYATAIAIELGLPSERVEYVRQAGFLHDIGKIAIAERVLHKPSRLTDEEYEYIKTHVMLGAEFLETSHGLRHLVPFIKHHHERWAGQGYPDGLKGAQIPLEARILGLCDAVEAMASDRPYHRGLSPDEIIAEVQRCAGAHFDPAVVEVFVRIVEREGCRFIVNSAHEVMRRHAEIVKRLPSDMHFQPSGVV